MWRKSCFLGGQTKKGGDIVDLMFSFDSKTEKWSTIGTMLQERSAHALSQVDLTLFKDFCKYPEGTLLCIFG